MKTQQNHKRNKFEEFTYKPKICKKSLLLTKDLHAKLNENKIPHYELLLYKGKEIEKKREQYQREKEELEKHERQLSSHRKQVQTNGKAKIQRNDTPLDQPQTVTDPVSINDEPSQFDNLQSIETRDEIGVIDSTKDYMNITSPRFTESDVVSPHKSTTPKFPILFVDINLGSNKIERITIYEGNASLQVFRRQSDGDRSGVRRPAQAQPEDVREAAEYAEAADGWDPQQDQ